jgi:hypothetical protein
MSQSDPTISSPGEQKPPKWDPQRSFFQNLAIRLTYKPGAPEWEAERKFLENLTIRLTSKTPWDPKKKHFETQMRYYVLLWFVITITILAITWVVYQPIAPAPIKELPAGADLAIVLAPVLAAAAGIERSLETLFGVIEGNARALVAYLGRGMRWLHNAETEVDSARQWLANVSAEYNRQLKALPFSGAAQAGSSDEQQPPQQEGKDVLAETQKKLQAAKDLMNLAEQRLLNAEQELSEVTSSDGYRNAKRAATIFLGLLLGLIVATASSLQMFAMLGVKVFNARADVIITGLVIGSGSAPVHSLINILQSAKEALDSAQGWLDANRPKKEDQAATSKNV